MNMVGYKGKGVSGWLSVATAYALNLWADICTDRCASQLAAEFRPRRGSINQAVNRTFGTANGLAAASPTTASFSAPAKTKKAGIFLNPQSWAILSGAASEGQRKQMLQAVAEQLETPTASCSSRPAFTAMREDIGRVTQKFPGSAENGSVYNHGAIFYIYSLYSIGEQDRAFRLMRQMLPGPDLADYQQRGQLPVFIPNYYRGAYYQHPRTAGRSSQLFNTGTVSWLLPLPPRRIIWPQRRPAGSADSAPTAQPLAAGQGHPPIPRRHLRSGATPRGRGFPNSSRSRRPEAACQHHHPDSGREHL